MSPKLLTPWVCYCKADFAGAGGELVRWLIAAVTLVAFNTVM